jgi:excisionase family DNA binding protein
MAETTTPTHVSINTVAERLGIKRHALYPYIKSGRLKVTKAGGLIFVRAEDLDEFLSHFVFADGDTSNIKLRRYVDNP